MRHRRLILAAALAGLLIGTAQAANVVRESDHPWPSGGWRAYIYYPADSRINSWHRVPKLQLQEDCEAAAAKVVQEHPRWAFVCRWWWKPGEDPE